MEKSSHLVSGKIPGNNLKRQSAYACIDNRNSSFTQRKRSLGRSDASSSYVSGRSRNGGNFHEEETAPQKLEDRKVSHNLSFLAVPKVLHRIGSAIHKIKSSILTPFSMQPYSESREKLIAILLNDDTKKAVFAQDNSEIVNVDKAAMIVSCESTKTCISTMKTWHARRKTFVNGPWDELSGAFKDLLARLGWFAISDRELHCRCYLCDKAMLIALVDEDTIDFTLKSMWSVHGKCHYIQRLLGFPLYKRLNSIMRMDDTRSLSSVDSGMSSESADEMDNIPADTDETMNTTNACSNLQSFDSEMANNSVIVRSASNDSFLCDDFGSEIASGRSTCNDKDDDLPLLPTICNFCSKYVKVTAIPCGHMFSCTDHIAQYLSASRAQNEGIAKCAYCRAKIENYCISRSAGFYDEEEVKRYHRKSLLAIEGSTRGAGASISKM